MKTPTERYSSRARRLLIGSLLVSALVIAGLILASARSVTAAPARQIPIYTPTPGPDGRILYTVKANDTLLSISLLTGVSVEDLRKLNNLNGDIIKEGQVLLLGISGPAEVTFTPGPSPTPTALLPTPSPKPGSGNLCVMLYADLNGDAIRQDDELGIPGGAISISNRSGDFSKTATTLSGEDPYCFEGIPEGDYNVSVAAPEGFNATTANNFALHLNAGDESYLGFGAQANSETLAEAPLPSEGGRSPMLGILGGALLVAGLGLGIFGRRLLKGR